MALHVSAVEESYPPVSTLVFCSLEKATSLIGLKNKSARPDLSRAITKEKKF